MHYIISLYKIIIYPSYIIWETYKSNIIWNKHYYSTEENDPQRATVLSIDTDLPKLYEACFTSYIFCTFEKRVAVWARFLLQFAIIGRSSDVTTHCPSIQKVLFPTHERDYLSDGLSRYIVIKLDDWKSRPTWHKTQLPFGYKIRIYANHIDTRFCPIHWLFSIGIWQVFMMDQKLVQFYKNILKQTIEKT